MGMGKAVFLPFLFLPLFFLPRAASSREFRVEGVLGRGGRGRLALSLDGESLFIASGGRLGEYAFGQEKERIRYSGNMGDPVFLGITGEKGEIVGVDSGGRIYLWKSGRPDPLREWDLGSGSGTGRTRILFADLPPGGRFLVVTRGWLGITAGGVLSALVGGGKKGGCVLESGLFQGRVDVFLVDLSGGEKPVRVEGIPGEKAGPSGAFFTGEGKALADWTSEGKMHFRGLPSLETFRTVDLGRKLSPLAFTSSPGGRKAAFFVDGGDILVLDVVKGRWSGKVRTGWEKILETRMVFTPDRKGIWTVGQDDKAAVLWDTETGKKIFVYRGEESIQDLRPFERGVLVLDREGKVTRIALGEKGPVKVFLPPGWMWIPRAWGFDRKNDRLFFSQGRELLCLDVEKVGIARRISFPGAVRQVSKGLDMVLWTEGGKGFVTGLAFDDSGNPRKGETRLLSFFPEAAFPGDKGFLAVDEKGDVHRVLPSPGGGIEEKNLGNLGEIPGFPEKMDHLARIRAFSGDTLFLSFSGDRGRGDRVVAWRIGKEGVKRVWVKRISSNVRESAWSLAADPQGGRVFLGLGNGKIRVLAWEDGRDLDLWSVFTGTGFIRIGRAVCFLAWVPGEGLACLGGSEFRLLDPDGTGERSAFSFPAEPDLLVPVPGKDRWVFFCLNGTLWVLEEKK